MSEDGSDGAEAMEAVLTVLMRWHAALRRWQADLEVRVAGLAGQADLQMKRLKELLGEGGDGGSGAGRA